MDIKTPEQGILKTGLCECIYEPRGDHGLEGYQLNEFYRFEFKRNKEGQEYYKVFPDKMFTAYGETCSRISFKKYFKEIVQE